jgi:hypothetical protein
VLMTLLEPFCTAFGGAIRLFIVKSFVETDAGFEEPGTPSTDQMRTMLAGEDEVPGGTEAINSVEVDESDWAG